MNLRSNSLKLAGLMVASALMLASCNKTVTNGKLDGAWKVTSGSSSGEHSTTSGGITTTTTIESTFDGATQETNTTSAGVTHTTESEMTINFTFDKKTGEYTVINVLTDPEYSTYYSQSYYTKDPLTGIYYYEGSYDKVIARVSTTTETGYYTVSGDAGDEIEKNSQVIFQERTSEEDYEDTYSYYEAGTDNELDLDDIYFWDSDDGDYSDNWASGGQGTITNDGMSPYSMVWNVSELKKGSMMVNWTSSNDYEDSNSDWSSSNSTSYNWTLTEQ